MNRAVLALLLSLTVAGAARAQDSADDAKKAAQMEEARQHVAKAKVHYDLGEFKEAADEYIIVYRLRPIPALLFNIAQAYRQGGMYDKAKQFYKSYLRESPNASNKTSIEQSIREMDELLAKERRAKDAAPLGVKEPPEATLPVKQPPPQVAEARPEPAPKMAKRQAEAILPPVTAPADATPSKPPATVAMATPSQQQPKTSVPVAATTATHTTTQPTAEEGGSVLGKWWFWTAVGVVAVGAGAAAMTMGGNAAPASHFPATPVFP